MKPEAAETLALQVLAWIVANDDLRDVFMGSAGLAEEDLRLRAGDACFLCSVLDFICMDDSWVIAFCDAHNVPYTDPLLARHALPGGEEVHWT